MTGTDLVNRIKALGYRNVELARLLGISEQAFNSKLRTLDVKISFVKELASVTSKSIYEWLDEEQPPVIVKEDGKPYDSNWKEKYYQLLEKYNACLEDKDKLVSDYKRKATPTDRPINK